MNRRYFEMVSMTVVFLLAAIASGIMCWSCNATQPLAGATSETTNGFVAVVRSMSGTPVSHALVRLRPEGYLSDTAEASIQYDSASIIDTVTDTSGRFRITGIDTGNYSIEIQDGTGEGALLRGVALKDSIIDCGIAVVTPSGGVRGNINGGSVAENIEVYVRVYGMERMARADPASGAFVLRNMPEGDHTIYFIASSAAYQPKRLHASVVSDSVNDVGKVSLFQFADWHYSMVLGLNTTASGADVSGDVYAFPVLVRCTSGNFNFSQAQPNGEDIRFTRSDSTPLPFEIERWDAAAQKAEIWVKMDTIFGNSDRQFITMLWGNPKAAAPLSKSDAVFDTASGFQGVWHLGETSGDSSRDATANRYHGLSPDSGKPQVSEGIIGNCRWFDGYKDYITMPNTASGKLNFAEDGIFTISVWVYADTLDSTYRTIAAKGHQQYFLQLTFFPNDKPWWEFSNFREADKWHMSTSPASGKQWALLTGVLQGSSQYLYCNGELVANTTTNYKQTASRDTSDDFTIGRFFKEAAIPAIGFCYFKGKIDEVSVSSRARNNEWIRLCYMNQRSDDRLVQFK